MVLTIYNFQKPLTPHGVKFLVRNEMNQSCESQSCESQSRSLVLNRETKWTIILFLSYENRVRVYGLGGTPPPRGPYWYMVIPDDLTITNIGSRLLSFFKYSPIDDLWRNRTFTSAQPGTELRKVNVRSESLQQHFSTATLHIIYPVDEK